MIEKRKRGPNTTPSKEYLNKRLIHTMGQTIDNCISALVERGKLYDESNNLINPADSGRAEQMWIQIVGDLLILHVDFDFCRKEYSSMKEQIDTLEQLFNDTVAKSDTFHTCRCKGCNP
jgi:hypothetical protein